MAEKMAEKVNRVNLYLTPFRLLFTKKTVSYSGLDKPR